MYKIICIGKLKGAYKDLFNDFYKRMKNFVKIIEIKESEKKRESKEIIRKLAKANERKILLDAKGKLIDFNFIKRNEGIYVIGGRDGVEREVFDRVDFVASFSKLTFNHQLFRIMLIEQIYRVYCEKKNLPYVKH